MATALSITAGGASKIVSALIEGGLVARSDDHTDARATVLNLTSSGADILRASLAIVDDEVRTLVGARLGDADSDMLLSLLRRLR